MKTFLKKSIPTLIIGVVALTVFFVDPVAAKYGLDEAAKTAGIPTSRSLTQIIGDSIGTALAYISVLFFLLMLYAGIIWMTARGNSDAEQKAKNTIIAAVIGIAIILGAYAVTKFVFDAVGAPGSSGPEKVTCESKGQGWSCVDVTVCKKADGSMIVTDPNSSVENRRAECNKNTQTCALNLCSNQPNNIVCCKL